MRALRGLSLLALIALAGCSTTGVAPEGALNGTWVTAPVPSGTGKSIDLRSSGTSVTGSGTDYGLQHAVIGTYTVSGTYKSASINLTMAYDDGSTATFSGHFVGTDTVQGTWSGPNGGELTLVRSN